MIAFEVHINGRKKCTAGIAGPTALTAALTWVFRTPAERGRGRPRQELNLGVGGMGRRKGEFLEWLQRDLHPGDEVIIRIVEAGRVDKPKRRRQLGTATAPQIRRRKERLVRRLAGEIGWKVQPE